MHSFTCKFNFKTRFYDKKMRTPNSNILLWHLQRMWTIAEASPKKKKKSRSNRETTILLQGNQKRGGEESMHIYLFKKERVKT